MTSLLYCTHTDAEFEQVKAELALEKEKTVGLRWLDIQNDYIIVSLRSDAVSLASRLNEASREHAELRVTLAASQAQVAKMREALEYVKESLEGRVGAEYVDRLDDLKLIDAALATTAPAAQAGGKDAT
jgi:hypothetical protein